MSGVKRGECQFWQGLARRLEQRGADISRVASRRVASRRIALRRDIQHRSRQLAQLLLRASAALASLQIHARVILIHVLLASKEPTTFSRSRRCLSATIDSVVV